MSLGEFFEPLKYFKENLKKKLVSTFFKMNFETNVAVALKSNF